MYKIGQRVKVNNAEFPYDKYNGQSGLVTLASDDPEHEEAIYQVQMEDKIKVPLWEHELIVDDLKAVIQNTHDAEEDLIMIYGERGETNVHAIAAWYKKHLLNCGHQVLGELLMKYTPKKGGNDG